MQSLIRLFSQKKKENKGLNCVYKGNKLSPYVREPPTGIQGHVPNVSYSFEMYVSKSVRTPELYLFKLFLDSKYVWLVKYKVYKVSAFKTAEYAIRFFSDPVSGLGWNSHKGTFPEYRHYSDTLFVNLAAYVIQKKWRDWSSRRHKAASIIQREWLDMYYNPTRGYCQARLHNDWQKCVESHQSFIK